MRKTFIPFACLFLFFFYFVIPSFAQDDDFAQKHEFTLGIGMEVLNYQEHEPGSSVDSESEPFNTIFKMQYQRKLSEKLTYGIKLILPVVTNVDGEEWRTGGFLFQSNSLSYQWMRMDTYVLSGGSEGLSALAGLRLGQAKQTRRNFVTPFSSSTISEAIEEINSVSLTLGAQFTEETKNTEWKLHALLAFPLYANVTNSAIPDASFNDKKGYTFETGAEVFFARKYSLGILWGVMHWNGSDWKQISQTQQAKWPENDTRYATALLSVHF